MIVLAYLNMSGKCRQGIGRSMAADEEQLA